MAFGEKGNLDDFYDPFERGLIFGTGWAGQDALLSANESYRQDNWASPFSNLMAMPSVATAAISKHWNLRGYQNTPVAFAPAPAFAKLTYQVTGGTVGCLVGKGDAIARCCKRTNHAAANTSGSARYKNPVVIGAMYRKAPRSMSCRGRSSPSMAHPMRS